MPGRNWPGAFLSGCAGALLLIVAGCSGTAPVAPSQPGPTPASVGSPKPAAPPPSVAGPPGKKYNLGGYPPAFREGFLAACDARKRGVDQPPDATRFKADAQYRLGWKDGLSLCAR